MKTLFINFLLILFFLSAGFQNKSILLSAQTTSFVKGIVFHDKNGNGIYDVKTDPPLKNIAVSNGREVVLTNQAGRYELPVGKYPAIFVIKPRNWKVPADDKNIHRFYYLHSPQGASGSNYKGLPPTGPIPEMINFPLYPVKEPDNFDVLILGDTQPRNEQEIHYFANDVLPGLIDINVPFGIILGDIVFDKLNLYDYLTNIISSIGIPIRYVPGNHDIDYTANNITDSRGTWFNTFGPTYYSFSYGPVHFIVLDDSRWIVEQDKRYYRTGLGEDQFEFVRNEIKRLKNDQLLVLLSHIPFEKSTAWESENEKKAFYEILASHPNTISLSAHTHRYFHNIIDKSSGFPGNNPLHMVSVGATCGGLYTGAPDEYGIPHAMMSDGTPKCYTILHINGNKWKLSWRAPGRPADFQMQIYAPESVTTDSTINIKVSANIFNALPSAYVKMKIDSFGDWIRMEKELKRDPFRVAVAEREKQIGEVPWINLANAAVSEHIWTAEPKMKLTPGVHVIYVKAVDAWWQYEGKRVLYVK